MADPIPFNRQGTSQPTEDEGGATGAPPVAPPPAHGSGGGDMNTPVTRGEMNMALAVQGVVQVLAILGILLAIYFGNVASNQAAGSLGMSLGQAVEASRAAFHDDMVRELDRRDREREQREHDSQPQPQHH